MRQAQSTPVRGRPRGGSERALNRERIVAAAAEVARVGGFDHFSLRRVADALGVDPSSLYYHFPNKASLLAAALEQASQEIELSEPPPGDWQERCLAFCKTLRAALCERPEATQLSAHGSVLTPWVIRASTILIDALAPTGLRGRQLILASQALLWQTHGMARLAVDLPQGPPASDAVSEVNPLVETDSTSGMEHGEWSALATDYAGMGHEDFFEYAIRTTLDGIERSLGD